MPVEHDARVSCINKLFQWKALRKVRSNSEYSSRIAWQTTSGNKQTISSRASQKLTSWGPSGSNTLSQTAQISSTELENRRKDGCSCNAGEHLSSIVAPWRWYVGWGRAMGDRRMEGFSAGWSVKEEKGTSPRDQRQSTSAATCQ